MKQEMIESAGKIWQWLGQEGETDVQKLPKKLNEKNEVVYASVGWLAREDKIYFQNVADKTLVGLIESEQQMFERLKGSRQDIDLSKPKSQKKVVAKKKVVKKKPAAKKAVRSSRKK